MASHYYKPLPIVDPDEPLTEALGDPLLNVLPEPEADSTFVTANIREHSRLGKKSSVR